MSIDNQYDGMKKRSTGQNFDIPLEEPNNEIKRRQTKTFIPDEAEQLNEVPESITAGERLPHVSEYTGIRLDALPLKGVKPFFYGISLLLFVLLGWEVFSVLQSLLEIHWGFACAFAALVAIVALMAWRVTRSFVKDRENIETLESIQNNAQHLSEVNDLGRARQLIEELKKFYLNKPQNLHFQRCLEQLPDYSNDREVVEHIERVFLMPLDKEALRRVSNYSLQTATTVAVSPWISLDMLFSLWRSIKMIDDIAQVYGLRPSIINRYKLLKLVMHQLVFVAASEVVLDQLIEEFGTSTLTSMSGARLGQGIGAGIYSARIGVAAMKVCRPICFSKQNQPTVRTIVVQVVNALKNKVRNINTESS
jgi:putative membrane protein